MKRKKYYYLDPVIIRIPGIKTLFEKSVGKRDARQNQVCSNGEVHTTPFIDAKVNSYNAHIEKLLLKTTNELAPMIQEANSLLVEYSLMESHKGGELPEGCGEEAQRQKAAVAANYALEERRKEEILKRLAKIRTESDIVDEMLVHYQEMHKGDYCVVMSKRELCIADREENEKALMKYRLILWSGTRLSEEEENND